MNTPIDREATIETYHYLCGRAARKFVREGVERADLEQIAAIGLIKAADRYQRERGTPFEAYAWGLILGELMHYVRDTERMLRAPRKVRELERRWAVAERELWASLGREPKISEVGRYLGVTHEQQREIHRYREARSVLSVDALPAYDQAALSYTIDRQLDRMIVESGFHILTKTEREVLVQIYERDTPIAEIAKLLGYSRRHITRLHREALRKLSPFACPAYA